MKHFNVLDRNEDLSGSCLVEASAGTGKTHSIENIVVRLLIDAEHPLLLEQIVVVTFTNAATEDLKERVRRNIFNMAALCKAMLAGEIFTAPDYLQAVYEQGEQAVFTALKSLEQALTFFDRAQIFTIHAFCQRMLKEFVFEGHFPVVEKEVSTTEIFQLIRDFFRTEVNEQLVSEEQLKRVLVGCKGIAQLEKKLIKYALGGAEIGQGATLEEQLAAFYSAMEAICSSHTIEPAKLLADFHLLAPAYKEICDAKKQPKLENIAKVQTFADIAAKRCWSLADFDLLIRDGVYWVKAFNEEKRDKRKKAPGPDLLHYPDLTFVLEITLQPVIEYSRHEDRILALLAYRCRRMIKGYFEQEGILNFDNILDAMQKALQNDAFVEKVQNRFPVAIIDEFQDTDPVQWDIFKTLFLNRKRPRLYLVGDPKQSIYAFRQADIYTYLDAAERLGRDNKATLSVNYRSTSKLIAGLNYLFSSDCIAGLMVLPRIPKTIPYIAVESSGQIVEKDYGDERAAINFFAVEGVEKRSMQSIEEEYYFPFIAKEILQMHRSGNLSFYQCAILVSDRYQAFRMGEYLKKRGIPYQAQRNKSIVSTPLFRALRELLEGILNPKHESTLKVALGGLIVAWDEQDLCMLEDLVYREQVVAGFMELGAIWMQKGFAAFFFALLNFRLPRKEATIVEYLLSTSGGDDLYRALDQIAGLLREAENRQRLSPFQLVDYFEELERMEFDDEGETKCLVDGAVDAVTILTIHSSKGLEYDVVFALGLVKKGKKAESLVPQPREGLRALLEVIDLESDPRYIAHVAELEAEKWRQLYVAWTRAKQRVYIPLLLDALNRRQETASCMELYITQLKQNQGSTRGSVAEMLLGRALLPEEEGLLELKAINYSISYTRLEASVAGDLGPAATEDVVLVEPLQPCIPFNPKILTSFTAYISNSQQKSGYQAQVYIPPRDFDVEDKSPHTLPAGMQTGILLHSIFETLPLAIIKKGPRNALLRAFVERFIFNGPFATWLDVICDIVYHTWTASFPLGESTFSLLELEEWDCYREHAFLYPCDGVSDLSLPDGFVKGIIDMVFKVKDKYYIADWKSNWLGPDATCYDPETLSKAMEEEGYLFQAKIYITALQRYLGKVDPRPFEEIFGGAYFLFLRGLTPGSSAAIFQAH